MKLTRTKMDLLPMSSISSSLRNASVKPTKVIQNLYLEFAQYQKSPEKPKKVPEPEPEPVVDLGRQWNSRVRLYIWLQLRKLYDAYVLGKKLTVNDENLRGLIRYILGDLSEMEVTFILNGLFKLDKSIEFIPFVHLLLFRPLSSSIWLLSSV